MLRRLSATPCPVGGGPSCQSQPNSILSDDDSNTTATTTIDFTAEFRASLRNVKPRRRQTAIRKVDPHGLDFTIHEDKNLHVEGPAAATGARAAIEFRPRRRPSIAQPPQRPKQRMSFVQVEEPTCVQAATASFASSLAQAPRRPAVRDNTRRDSTMLPRDDTLFHIPSPKITKPARRGTIYIPSDDTTMPSMYMGIFSPLKLPMTGTSTHNVPVDDEITGLAAQMARKKGPRKSILAASPKRIALHPSTRSLQVTAAVEDRVGQPSGKENIPPGHSGTNAISRGKPRMSILKVGDATRLDRVSEGKQPPASRLFEPTASSSARSKELERSSRTLTKPSWNAGVKLHSSNQPLAKIKESARPRSASPKHESDIICKPKVPNRIVVPSIKSEPIEQHFPLLPEGIVNPSMYEDNWLVHQEIAMTQLINDLFESSMPKVDRCEDDGMLRYRLLELYGNSEMALLYRRVQGALLYGALSIPQDIVDQGGRLSNDLGQRQAFTDIWLQAYDHHILRTALEVVVGRLSNPEGRVPDESHHDARNCNSNCRRSLQTFIETFLIRNEDLVSQPEALNQGRSLQRTVLRSLMLVKLLDMTKTCTQSPMAGNLFQTASQHKTSTKVVQTVIQMLNPSAGDPLRALNHLGYSVQHAQYPLQEYSYCIENLAVDLRDGVRLTRLVELLLYRAASPCLEHARDTAGTTTLFMPAGEVLSLVEGQQDWPLSQHLKVPCQSRTAKLFNVQIGLSALESVRGMELLVRDIRAEDIVDGFREKTARLLWGLSSKWGLRSLVDWEDVKREIKRLRRKEGFIGSQDEGVADFDDEGEADHIRYKALLRAWAKAVAGSQGLAVQNFTTSFADGRAFGAIVAEYEPYLVQASDQTSHVHLPERLKRLGCSEQFSQLFAMAGTSSTSFHHHQHIFDRDFVLASLAFLCSRLLGPSRKNRAATVIQRAWRGHWAKIEDERQQQLQRLALACAQEVRSRHETTAIEGNGPQSSLPSSSLASEVAQAVCVIGTTRADEEDIWLSL